MSTSMSDIEGTDTSGGSPNGSVAGENTSLFGMIQAAIDSLPESGRPTQPQLLEILTAMETMLLLQSGSIHPDLRETEEEKARRVFQNYGKVFNALFALRWQTPSVTYEPGMAPIYRLPIELLARIFVVLAEQPPPEYQAYASPIALSHVCRSWKTIAEQTPKLWCDMAMVRGLNWTQRALRYSQNTPLDVVMSPFETKKVDDYKQAVRLTLAELPRIRSLHLGLDHDASVLSEAPGLLCSKPASMLSKLEYRGPSYGDEGVDNLDANLFAGTCPEQLRVADIRDATIHLNCPIFQSQLTTLSLHHCSVWATVDDMMRTLKGLPSLERFTWLMHEEVGLHMDERDRVETEPRSVRLPRLQMLELQDEIEIPLSIFTCLDIPSSASVAIHGFLENVIWHGSLDTVLVRLDQTLGAHLRAALDEDSFTTLTLMEFADHNDSGYSVAFEKPSLSASPQKFMLGFCFLSDYVDEYTRLLARMLSWEPCARAIRQVSMRYDLEFLQQTVTWKMLLERLPLVMEIQVRDGAGLALLSCLAEDWERAATLRRAVIREAKGIADMDIFGIVKSFEARSAATLPRISLSIINCDITEDQVVALEQCTGTDKVVCYPRVSKEMIEMAKRFGFELPLAAMLPPAAVGAVVVP